MLEALVASFEPLVGGVFALLAVTVGWGLNHLGEHLRFKRDARARTQEALVSLIHGLMDVQAQLTELHYSGEPDSLRATRAEALQTLLRLELYDTQGDLHKAAGASVWTAIGSAEQFMTSRVATHEVQKAHLRHGAELAAHEHRKVYDEFLEIARKRLGTEKKRKFWRRDKTKAAGVQQLEAAR